MTIIDRLYKAVVKAENCGGGDMDISLCDSDYHEAEIAIEEKSNVLGSHLWLSFMGLPVICGIRKSHVSYFASQDNHGFVYI